MSLLLIWIYFTTFSRLSIIDFEQVNVSWDETDIRLFLSSSCITSENIPLLLKKSKTVRKKSLWLTVALVRFKSF